MAKIAFSSVFANESPEGKWPFSCTQREKSFGDSKWKAKGLKKKVFVRICVFGWGAELPNISLQIKPRGRHFHNFTATPFRKHENVSEENCNVYDTSALFFLSFSEGGI